MRRARSTGAAGQPSAHQTQRRRRLIDSVAAGLSNAPPSAAGFRGCRLRSSQLGLACARLPLSRSQGPGRGNPLGFARDADSEWRVAWSGEGEEAAAGLRRGSRLESRSSRSGPDAPSRAASASASPPPPSLPAHWSGHLLPRSGRSGGE